MEKLEEKRETVRIAGRMMSRRDMGKANFIDVRDKTDRIQVYVRMQLRLGQYVRVICLIGVQMLTIVNAIVRIEIWEVELV